MFQCQIYVIEKGRLGERHGHGMRVRQRARLTLATLAFLKPCSVATASQSMSALFLVCFTMAKKNMASEAVGSFFLGVVSAIVLQDPSCNLVSVKARNNM